MVNISQWHPYTNTRTPDTQPRISESESHEAIPKFSLLTSNSHSLSDSPEKADHLEQNAECSQYWREQVCLSILYLSCAKDDTIHHARYQAAHLPRHYSAAGTWGACSQAQRNHDQPTHRLLSSAISLSPPCRRSDAHSSHQEASAPSGNHKCLTIQTGRQSVVIFNQDGQPMLSNPNSPPHSPDNVPEIHITLPDEQDELGRRKSGRVVVVRVGDGSIGLEPVQEEQLPAYDKEGRSGFYSIDIDQIGGLKEKDRKESM